MSLAEQYWDAWQSSGAVRPTSWRGVPMIKDPIDVYLFAEAIHRTSPDLIVETGTWHGGSALMFADLIAPWDGVVVSIDPEPATPPSVDPYAALDHDRIAFVQRSSLDNPVVSGTELVAESGGGRIMVVLDSLHTAEHVRAELDIYAPLVTPGCYLVIEDTSHTGAGDAAREFASAWPDEWEDDQAMSRFGVTFNTWLLRR